MSFRATEFGLGEALGSHMRVLNKEVVKFRLPKDSFVFFFFQYSTKYGLRNLRCLWECHTVWMGLVMWKSGKIL